MTYYEAKPLLRKGAVMRREAWVPSAEVQAETLDPDHALVLIDESGRIHGLSYMDQISGDWIIVNEGEA